MVQVVIHSNPHLDNQIESAGWLQEGFKRHGIAAEITADKHKAADVHVIQGNWYAYHDWVGKPNVLFLNRCYFGHPRWDVSIGWLNPDGSRDFRNDGMAVPNGTLPRLKPRKTRRRCAVIFGDYGQDVKEVCAEARQNYDAVFFRPHPQEPKRNAPVLCLRGEIGAVWEIADVAIGHSTTALVDAKINGLHIECSDPRNVVNHDGDREQWLTDLSWAQWNHEAIKRGDFWEHLKC